VGDRGAQHEQHNTAYNEKHLTTISNIPSEDLTQTVKRGTLPNTQQITMRNTQQLNMRNTPTAELQESIEQK
jgi:hypothetical protein